MNYLIYIEHAAENLQFFLWYRDYISRFLALPDSERGLAPEWTISQIEAEAVTAQMTNMGPKKMSPETAAVFKGTDFAPGARSPVIEYGLNPFHTPPSTPPVARDCCTPSEYGWSDDGSTLKSNTFSFAKKTAGAYEGAEVKWQPCKYKIVTTHCSKALSF